MVKDIAVIVSGAAAGAGIDWLLHRWLKPNARQAGIILLCWIAATLLFLTALFIWGDQI